MLRIRTVTPEAWRDAVLEDLHAHPAVINIVIVPGAARKPDGDLITFDVAREAANEVIARLRSFDLHRHGSITVERIDASLSDAAARAEALAPGDPSDAVVWEEVEARVRSDSGWTITFKVLIVLSGLIAAIGVMTDSPVLIVGAMVVGPEYGPVALIAYGLYTRRPYRIRRGLRVLAVGLATAIAAAFVLTLVLRLVGRVPDAYRLDQRPLTDFISSPDLYAGLVALLAGIAGAVTVAEARHGALVGVLISVTTIPAAANVGVALAVGRADEAVGALGQLVLNLAILASAGALTFAVQARWSRR